MVQTKSQKADIPNTSEAPVVSGAMDPALKAKWVEALRSGAFKQGRDALLNDGAYCCLGVLCEVADMTIVEARDSVVGAEGACGYNFLDRYVSSVNRFRLIDMNDTGKSFLLIADHIEANIPTTENSVRGSSS